MKSKGGYFVTHSYLLLESEFDSMYKLNLYKHV